jgi:hypothetical protein
VTCSGARSSIFVELTLDSAKALSGALLSHRWVAGKKISFFC